MNATDQTHTQLNAIPGQPNPDVTREHHDEETVTFDLDKLIAAIPDVVNESMQRTLPNLYTPDLAADFAQRLIAKLRQDPDRTRTAAERGPDWMARWGCPGWCVTEHGKPEAMEAHSTDPVESTLRASEGDCSGYSANGEGLPWMTAQVVVNDRDAQEYGRETKVWLGYGVHLAELSPVKAREALDAMRAFVTRLSAVVDFAEQVAAEDFAGDPEIARLDREADDRRTEQAGGDQ